MYTIHEIVSLYNNDNDEKTTYYKVRDVANSEKQIVLQGKTPDDDCRLKMIGEGLLVQNLPDDPMEVVELGVCSIKNLLCMKGECDECVPLATFSSPLPPPPTNLRSYTILNTGKNISVPS